MSRNVNRHQVSLYPHHSEWVETQREENENWKFSTWVQEQIEEEQEDAPAFLDSA